MEIHIGGAVKDLFDHLQVAQHHCIGGVARVSEKKCEFITTV